MQILEDAVPVRARRACPCVSIAPRVSPAPSSAQADSSVAVRSVTGPRTDWAKFCRAARIVLLLERANADHETGDAVGVVDLQEPVGELAGLIDIAVGEHGEEGAARADRDFSDRP